MAAVGTRENLRSRIASEPQELEILIEIATGTGIGMDETKTENGIVNVGGTTSIGTLTGIAIEQETETEDKITQKVMIGTRIEIGNDIVKELVMEMASTETQIAQSGILLVIANTGTGTGIAQEAQTAGPGSLIVLATSRAMDVVAPALLVGRRVQVGAVVVGKGEIALARRTLAKEVPVTRWMLIQTLMMKTKRQKWPV
ncbi:hypothetical protein PGT21_029138 [Puccinia graminis f. sp. tritici]|uniref:Uncharacterized protein n=1 Tax=Puccinia graminis f. sp. tritici TaxID=56615 RepID=A0A5B0PHY6_PUCGR|nr:hypothetical protein PGT21_029138 [Puccinia graminis f. sp. tritici]KAA1128171.1 hypothetical protein PGTUg99_018919 [Puccinia graminis f. sp. tritici]